MSPLEAGLAMLSAAAIGALSWLARYVGPTHTVTWAMAPLVAVAAIAAIDFLTSDASVSAQVFFFFPTLYGTSQLRPAGAIVTTAGAALGEITVVASMAPAREAITDIGYVVTALVTTAALLIRAGQRQERLIAKLKRQAAIDPLTGLVTRRVLDEAAQSAMTGAASRQGTSLLLLDVDNFKQINDRYGHPAGDDVLVQLADLLVRSSRSDDVVSRMGGDEVALLLPGCAIGALLDRAEQLVWDVRAHQFTVNDTDPITLSVSVGLAHAPTHAEDLRSLYAAADAALYEAKHAGRNRVGAPITMSEAAYTTGGPIGSPPQAGMVER
jgi:diguanylate cyclase (GGDEF)-like protein